MIKFIFPINTSFLEYKFHPITIPKAHYDDLKAQNLESDHVSIASPYGSMRGVIIFSTAGYGPYYQIQVRGGHSNDALSQFQIGQKLRVEIARMENKVQINLILLSDAEDTSDEGLKNIDCHERTIKDIERLILAKELQYTDSKPFDPKDIEDGRARTLASVVRRRGQPAFRQTLLTIYQGKCAITGTDAEQALESAHIIPYLGDKTNHPSNGLLLRADLHTLFDLRLIAIDTAAMKVLVSPKLMNTTYKDISGLPLRLPQNSDDWPSKEALDIHRNEAGL